MLRISTVIPTHNRAVYLRSALESLASQTLSHDEYEVIVVDNASTDDTGEVVRRMQESMSCLRYLREERLGLNWARNAGGRVCLAPYIAYLDDDARADPGWLESILSAFESVTPSPACVGGPVRLDWGGPPPSWLPNRYWRWYSHLDYGDRSRFLRAEELLVGANMAFARAVLELLDWFPTDIGRRGTSLLSGDESALMHRMKASGRMMYYAGPAVVLHTVQKERRRRLWLWTRMFWDGASQPVLDHGASQARSFYALQAYRDLRRIAFFSWILARAFFQGEGDHLLDCGLDVLQRVGRLRSHVRLACGRSR